MIPRRHSPWSGIEPDIDEILSDPIVVLLMESDGVNSGDSIAALRCAAFRDRAPALPRE
jgi:hypothetical protein